VSPTVAVSQRAAALKARGSEVLDLSVGQPDQPTPPHIRAAAEAALEAGLTRYTPPAGLPELRRAVARRYRKDHGVVFDADEVMATNGGKHALYSVCQVILDRGDEVVIPSPHWPTFAEAVRLAGARPVLVRASARDGFRVTARLISSAVTPRTKALILCSPSNPTGVVVVREELQKIGALARRRGLTVLFDDTYAHLVYGRRDRAALAELREKLGTRLLVLGTASKCYCMTGWRIGWALGPRPVIDACAALASHSTQCPTAFAQAGAIRALTGSQLCVRELAREYRRRRDLLHGAIVSIPGVTCHRPDGSLYLFPDLRSHLGRRWGSTLELAAGLLEEERVAVVPGEGFGTPGFIRLSFAAPAAELTEAAHRLAAFCSRHPSRRRSEPPKRARGR
jgi:aspartate aminotransferase